jgi:glycosyltransferase involved in cell wall biosynthesis
MRCLVIHGNLADKGGAELFALRTIRTLLRAGYHVDVLHGSDHIDWSDLFKWAGFSFDVTNVTDLAETDSAFKRRVGRAKSTLLRYAYALRRARNLAPSYDLVFSTFGELPLAHERAIQFFHVPLFFYDRESLRYLGADNLSIRKRLLRVGYVVLCRLVAGWSRGRVEGVRALANSCWTASQATRHYPRLHPTVSYIGASTENLESSNAISDWWEQRKNTIVVLGRVVPSKKLERAIQLVIRLRRHGHDVSLLILGNGDGAYADSITRAIEGHPFIEWKRGLPRSQLEQEIQACKWGLHCAPHEHYGLAAIELQRLGCLTFVPNSCGQAELSKDERFKYSDDEDLFNKFSSVLTSSTLREDLNNQRVALVQQHLTGSHDQYMFDLLRSLNG